MAILRQTEFRSATNAAAYRHWCGLLSDDRLPARKDLAPEMMVRFLPNVMLMDVIREPEMDFRYRLIGTYHRRFWIRDLTGKCIRHTEQQGPGTKIWAGLSKTAETGEPQRTLAPYVGPKKDIYEIEDILMPLAADGKTVDMIFVCCDYISKS